MCGQRFSSRPRQHCAFPSYIVAVTSAQYAERLSSYQLDEFPIQDFQRPAVTNDVVHGEQGCDTLTPLERANPDGRCRANIKRFIMRLDQLVRNLIRVPSILNGLVVHSAVFW